VSDQKSINQIKLILKSLFNREQLLDLMISEEEKVLHIKKSFFSKPTPIHSIPIANSDITDPYPFLDLLAQILKPHYLLINELAGEEIIQNVIQKINSGKKLNGSELKIKEFLMQPLIKLKGNSRGVEKEKNDYQLIENFIHQSIVQKYRNGEKSLTIILAGTYVNECKNTFHAMNQAFESAAKELGVKAEKLQNSFKVTFKAYSINSAFLLKMVRSFSDQKISKKVDFEYINLLDKKHLKRIHQLKADLVMCTSSLYEKTPYFAETIFGSMNEDSLFYGDDQTTPALDSKKLLSLANGQEWLYDFIYSSLKGVDIIEKKVGLNFVPASMNIQNLKKLQKHFETHLGTKTAGQIIAGLKKIYESSVNYGGFEKTKVDTDRDYYQKHVYLKSPSVKTKKTIEDYEAKTSPEKEYKGLSFRLKK